MADKKNDTVDTGDPRLGTPSGVKPKKSLEDARDAAREGTGSTTVSLDDANDKGYYGTSPQREATGLDDKGLSQQTAQVMEPVKSKD